MDISFGFGAAEGGRRSPRLAGSALLPKIALTLLVIGTFGQLAARGTFAAFKGTDASGAGTLTSGTVYITSDTEGQAMLSMPNGAPGSTVTSYTNITYGGTLSASVRLYGRSTGTGLARFLTLTITRGTRAEGAFVPDPINYAGAGPGIVYSGTLADLPANSDSGIADPGTWAQGESHTFEFVVTLTDDPRASGLTADSSFSFEARNV